MRIFPQFSVFWELFSVSISSSFIWLFFSVWRYHYMMSECIKLPFDVAIHSLCISTLSTLLHMNKYLIREKKVGDKWQNFLQVTNFFPDEIFPQPVFFPDSFSPDKEFIPIFLIPNYYYFPFICKIYYYHFFFFFFFWCTLSIFNKNFETRVKARNWKK